MQDAIGNNPQSQCASEPPLSEMGEQALSLARQGFNVFPLHEPLFDEQGELLGCTCNKGSQCGNIGKHPRVKWRTGSTAEAQQIGVWWRRWPNANIGIDCGKSGILVLDHDTYKDTYAGDKLELDEETVTVLTGGGGAHLWYRMPEGKKYRCSKGSLPAGIDVKGDGGYVVVPPSLHASGRRYTFELTYGLGEVEVKLLPQDLQDILDASRPNGPLPEASITEPPSTAPDLSQWRLSGHILDLIHHPRPKGQRSEADMTVCVALCYAGALDKEIYGVFAHYPIGAAGKFRERGKDYLLLTLRKARRYVGNYAPPDPEELRDLRRWVRSTSFKDFVPKELQCKVGYRTDGTDTKMADALLDVAEERGSWVFRAGLKELRDKAGLGSKGTAKKALERLDGWFVEVVEPSDGKSSTKYRIMTDVVLRSYPITIGRTSVIGYDLNTTYSAHKGEDVFLRGRSRTAKRGHLNLPNISETLLRVIDALEQHNGELNRRQLAGITGKSLSAIRVATRYGSALLGILKVSQKYTNAPKYYSLAPDAWEKIEELAPQMRTHKLRIERKERDYESIQLWCEDTLYRADCGEIRLGSEQRARLEQRRAWAIEGRMECLYELLPDLSEEGLLRNVAAPVPGNLPHPFIRAKERTERGRKKGREHYKREHVALLLEAEEQMRQSKIPLSEWSGKLAYLGFTPKETKRIISIARSKERALRVAAKLQDAEKEKDSMQTSFV